MLSSNTEIANATDVAVAAFETFRHETELLATLASITTNTRGEAECRALAELIHDHLVRLCAHAASLGALVDDIAHREESEARHDAGARPRGGHQRSPSSYTAAQGSPRATRCRSCWRASYSAGGTS
ncbi:MAG: hypothetical protein R3B07_32155 [Polyangiaceae bacterium]